MADRAEAQHQGVPNLEGTYLVGTRRPPFFKRKEFPRPPPAAPVQEGVPGPAGPQGPRGPVLPVPFIPAVPRGRARPVPIEEIRDDSDSSGSSVDSVTGAREALDEAVPAYLTLDEARRRLEREENDLPGNEGVGETGGREGPRFARLRRRAAWVHEAAATFRAWRPDEMIEPRAGGIKSSLESLRTWLAELYGNGVELIAGQRVELGVGNEDECSSEGLRRTDVLLQLSMNGGVDRVNVSLGILSRLVCFFTFRPKDKSTLMLARGKAIQYAKELGMPPELTAQVLAGSVALGITRTVDETATRRAILMSTNEAFDEEPSSFLGLVEYLYRPRAVEYQPYVDAAPEDRQYHARLPYVIGKAGEWYLPQVVSAVGKYLWQRSGQ